MFHQLRVVICTHNKLTNLFRYCKFNKRLVQIVFLMEMKLRAGSILTYIDLSEDLFLIYLSEF